MKHMMSTLFIIHSLCVPLTSAQTQTLESFVNHTAATTGLPIHSSEPDHVILKYKMPRGAEHLVSIRKSTAGKLRDAMIEVQAVSRRIDAFTDAQVHEISVMMLENNWLYALGGWAIDKSTKSFAFVHNFMGRHFLSLSPAELKATTKYFATKVDEADIGFNKYLLVDSGLGVSNIDALEALRISLLGAEEYLKAK